MADLKKSIEIIFEGNDQASRKASDVIAKVNELDTASKTAAKGGDQLSGSLENIGKSEPTISKVNAAIAALASSLVFKAFIDANVATERFENGLKALYGTSIDTSRELEYVRSTANKLGLDVQTTADSYLQLTAATRGTRLEGQQTRDIFEAVSKAMGALGKSSADTEGALLAISQIVSKGTVSMEELRGQLGERLPGAFQIAARSMGVTTQELDKLVSSGKLTAEEFLPRFARALDDTFANAAFNGYTQEINRLKNSIDELLVQAGKAGVFSALTAGVDVSTNLVRILGRQFSEVGELYDGFTRFIRNGDIEQLGEDFARATQRTEQFNAQMEFGVNQTLAETSRLARQAGEAAARIAQDNQSDAETQRLIRQANAVQQVATEYEQLLKRLGVDNKKTSDGIRELSKDLEDLARNPKSNGEEFSQAFNNALKKVQNAEQLDILRKSLESLFKDGKVSAETYDAALKALTTTNDKLTGATEKQAKAAKQQADETKRAEDAAQKMRLELEKIASNERLKGLELRIKLNIAELEAQTKQVEAAFESINTTVNSTGDLLGDLFGLFKDYDSLSFGAIREVKAQIDTENARRQEALNLQKQLIEAQVAQLRAQTRSLEKGDSLIKVDGAGLQPHLEAFMFEILRTIQVRVNQDGLKLLLGV